MCQGKYRFIENDMMGDYDVASLKIKAPVAFVVRRVAEKNARS
jgi:hypothetical protein